ncbi:acyl-CoA thioesterase [Sneathiella limimaris]|uniref:acyl-CoA thioesterase n=1 Tax=Sneathiella limimaris TaxID=1964213 RepID=UPI00146B5F07|nr:thioesterase family protein [Sneathiella limimaris]
MNKEDFGFLFEFRVRYSEIDGQGVVFNAHYLTYFDVAITEYFRDMGFDYVAYPKETGCDFHLVKSLVNYEKPLLFDTEFQVGCRIAKVGNSSLTFELGVYDKKSDERYATGEIIWVNTDQQSHKTERVPDNIREMIDLYQH